MPRELVHKVAKELADETKDEEMSRRSKGHGRPSKLEERTEVKRIQESSLNKDLNTSIKLPSRLKFEPEPEYIPKPILKLADNQAILDVPRFWAGLYEAYSRQERAILTFDEKNQVTKIEVEQYD